jgi:hypothetical protein
VTKNWRITFRIDQIGIEIIDLDYEDYHKSRIGSDRIALRFDLNRESVSNH